MKWFEALESRRMMCVDHAAENAPAPLPTAGAIAATLDQSAPPPATVAAATSASLLSWYRGASMPQAREEGASAALNGKLFVFGGFHDHTFNPTTRSDAYDPKNGQWRQKKSMPEPITHAPTIVINNEAWLFGGYVGKDPGPSTKKVYVYNPNSDTWRRGPDMPYSRGASAAARVGNFVYVFGGRDLARRYEVGQTFAYDITKNSWSTRASLPNPRNHLAGAAVEGKVYAIGGQLKEAKSSVNQRSVHRYDPGTNTWTSVSSLPIAMSHNVASTFEYKGRIVVVGGETSHNVASKKTLVYEPWKKAWKYVRDLSDVRRAPQAGIINGKLYVAGGSVRGGQRADLFISSSLDSIL